MAFEFKQLEIEVKNKGIKGLLKSQQFKKTMLYIVIGAAVGFGLFYFTEGRHMESFALKDAARSMLFGGFLGFFITNSPCARNKC